MSCEFWITLPVISHVLSWPLLLDTAQLYKNEHDAGIAIRNSGLKREEIYVTTKYSATDGLDVQTSIRNSLKYVSTVTPSEICSITSTIGSAAGSDVCRPLPDPLPPCDKYGYSNYVEGI